MNPIHKIKLALFGTLVLPLSFLAPAAATEEPSTAELQQKLQGLREENTATEKAKLQEQIAAEEKKKAELQGSASQPAPQAAEQEKSTWVRERNRVEDQVSRETARIGKQAENLVKKLF